jgi:hypothetical protein
MFLDTIIKNLCCAAITGATNNLLTGSAGDRNQSLIAFFQSVDALVHITPHPQDVIPSHYTRCLELRPWLLFFFTFLASHPSFISFYHFYILFAPSREVSGITPERIFRAENQFSPIQPNLAPLIGDISFFSFLSGKMS